MFGLIGFFGIVVLVLGCGVFLGLAPDRSEPEARPHLPTPRPTAERPADPAPLYVDPATLQAVLSLLERHVRQEQAAVEDFSTKPSAEHLRSQTMSPFVH